VAVYESLILHTGNLFHLTLSPRLQRTGTENAPTFLQPVISEIKQHPGKMNPGTKPG